MAWYDDLNRQAQQSALGGGPQDWATFSRMQSAQPQKTVAPKKKDKGFWLDQISTGGGIGGALAGGAAGAALGSAVPIVGTAIGGLLGAILGGGAGSAGGEVAENAITGDDLTKNVLSEGLIGGVTSLPIGAGFKLAKAGFKGATGAKDAALDLVEQAGAQTVGKKTAAKYGLTTGTSGASTGIRGKAADAAGRASDSLAIKGLQLAPAADLGKFRTKYGEDVAQVVKRNNLIGKSAEEFDPAIGALNDAFSSVIDSVPAISKKQLSERLTKVYQPLLDSPVLSKQTVGKSLKEQADAIVKSQGEAISAADLNKLRQAFDSEVNYASMVANPERYGVNKRAADALRDTIREAADTAGITVDGRSLKEIGSEVNKLRFIQDAAMKRQNNGRGSGPIGLRNLMAASAGGGAGGVPGLVAGATAAAVGNSPKVLRSAAGGLDNLSDNLAQGTTRAGGQGVVPLGVRQGLGRALMPSEDTQPEPTTLEEALALQGAGGMDAGQQQAAPSNPTGYSSAELAQALMQAYAAGDQASAEALESMYALASEYETANVQKPLSAEASKVISNANSGLTSLDQLEGLISQNGGEVSKATLVPGRDAVGGLLGNALGTSEYDTVSRNIADVITRLRTGAALTAQEEKFYNDQLPKAFDSPEVIQRKLQMFRDLFSSVSSQTGSAGTSLEQAVMGGY